MGGCGWVGGRVRVYSVCVCVRARAHARVCVCVCVCSHQREGITAQPLLTKLPPDCWQGDRLRRRSHHTGPVSERERVCVGVGWVWVCARAHVCVFSSLRVRSSFYLANQVPSVSCAYVSDDVWHV